MKILLAGTWRYKQYEAGFADGLRMLGHEVVPFAFDGFFVGRSGRCQEALPFPGPGLLQLNRALAQSVVEEEPDILLMWRATHVLPMTVRRIREMGVFTISHNHDDPFGPLVNYRAPWHHRFLWTWYWKCLRDVDLTIVNRAVNVGEATALGATNVRVLIPYYVAERHRPMVLSPEDRQRFTCDAVFVGHYEQDGREEYLRALVQGGLHVRLFGGGYWTRNVLAELTDYFGDVSPVYDDEYVKALCGAKVCLAFMSKMNRDTYTSRCFEIPACGQVLLSERTDDLKRMFREDKEAVFFSSKDELVEKAVWLVSHPEEREQIASAGRRRVIADGHDARGRAGELLRIIGDLPRRAVAGGSIPLCQ